LRSSRALYAYFDSLFPGKVHSASVNVEVPELDSLCARRKRVTRRLEKSIAHYKATGKRPTHIVGRPRLMLCGIETEPLNMFSCSNNEAIDMNMTSEDDFKFVKGNRVDSITYYFQDLNRMNRQVQELQQETSEIAEKGSGVFIAQNWTDKLLTEASFTIPSAGKDEEILFPNGKDDGTFSNKPRCHVIQEHPCDESKALILKSNESVRIRLTFFLLNSDLSYC